MDSFGLYEPITTRDQSSGRFHERVRVGTRLLVDERCNLDVAGAYDVMPRGGRADRGDGIPIGTDPAMVCKFCFPDDEDEPEVSTDSV